MNQMILSLIEELRDHAKILGMAHHTPHEKQVSWRAADVLTEIFSSSKQPSRYGTVLLSHNRGAQADTQSQGSA